MSFIQRLRLAVVILVIFLPALYTRAAPPTIGPCQVFPVGNPWNMDVSSAPVDPNSASIINTINGYGGDFVHPDFGENPDYGIPYITVTSSQPEVDVEFEYDDESDEGPYPIPPDAPIEGGEDADGDRHVLMINTDTCILYELYYAYPQGSPITHWTAGSGAIWDLNSDIVQQRPLGWTSADAAGLPIFPGLAKCDEANSGTINHAFRFTVSRTQEAYIYPASHLTRDYPPASYPYYPPMGMRFRLKANYDLSDYEDHPQALAIATALKKYGMMVADNGSNWYISGETNPGCWDDDDLDVLKDIPGTAFEVVSIISPAAASPVRNFYTTSTAPLSWARLSWATGYEIQVSSTSAFIGAPILPAGTANTFLTAALANGTYYWHVRAVGSTVWSPTESFVIRA